MNDSTQFKIEKGVPLPKRPGGRRTKYPWDSMEVGDSFFAEGKIPSQFSTLIKQIRRSRGFKFSCRSVEGGTRVWRIA